MLTLYSELVCRGGDSCCNLLFGKICEEGEGDCDTDLDCKLELKCGSQNCQNKSGYQWDKEDDCCYNPSNFIFNELLIKYKMKHKIIIRFIKIGL